MLNNLPDLNRLGVFHVVFAERGITKAAEKLHITRSAVSQSIKLLEEELDEELFVRRGRNLFPTVYAQGLFAIIDTTITSLKERNKVRASSKGQIVGQLRISSPPLFASRFLIPAIAEFHSKYPGIRFEMMNLPISHLIESLEQDKIDFAIIDSIEVFLGKRSIIQEKHLLSEHEIMVCTKEYLKKISKTNEASYQELVRANFVCYDFKGSDAKLWFKLIFKKIPDQISVSLSGATVFDIVSAVRAGLGFGLIPSHMIEKEIQKGTLVPLFPNRTHIQNKLDLIQLKSKKEPSHLRLFVEHLISHLKK